MKKYVLIALVILALLLRTFLVDLFRYRQIRLRATGTVDVVKRPVPVRMDASNEVIATLHADDSARVLRIVFGGDYTAVKVRLEDGRRGYVFKSDSVVVR